MNVGAADATVCDGDVNVVFFPDFWLVFPPDHFAVHRVCVKAKPTLPLVA